MTVPCLCGQLLAISARSRDSGKGGPQRRGEMAVQVLQLAAAASLLLSSG